MLYDLGKRSYCLAKQEEKTVGTCLNDLTFLQGILQR